MRYTTDIEVDVTEKNISMQSSLYLGCDRSMIRECRDRHSLNYWIEKPLSPKSAVTHHQYSEQRYREDSLASEIKISTFINIMNNF